MFSRVLSLLRFFCCLIIYSLFMNKNNNNKKMDSTDETRRDASKIMRGKAIEVHVDRVTANAYILCLCIYV